MRDINGLVAWVTGGGTGIGEGMAAALAQAGAIVVITGRREAPLQDVADRIKAAGGKVDIKPADLTDWSSVEATVEAIRRDHGRLDILVNNAGVNIPDRNWDVLKPESIAPLLDGNLKSAAYCAQAVLAIMRDQGDGQMIHTSSWAGRFIGPTSGPIYTAAKHGVVALSHTINLEEGPNGIRSTVVCPGEVATPLMAKRNPPEPPEVIARMVQPEDMGEVAVFLARQPPHVCINEMLVTPTHNRAYRAQMGGRKRQQDAVRAAAAKASGA